MIVTFKHPTGAIKCDMATDHAALVSTVMQFTAVNDGIHYALPNLLLADKIHTYGERRFADVGKRVNGLLDIERLLQIMMAKRQILPQDLKESILSGETLEAFFAVLDEDERERETFRDGLAEIVIIFEVSTHSVQ